MAGVAIGGPEHGAAERVVSEPATGPTSHSHPAPQQAPAAHATTGLEREVVRLDLLRPVGTARHGFEREPGRFILREISQQLVLVCIPECPSSMAVERLEPP